MTEQERLNIQRAMQPFMWAEYQRSKELNVPDATDIPDISEMYSHKLTVDAAKGEDQLLIEVLQEHLGRLVFVQDFKDCQIKYIAGRPNEYIFAHLGVDLGIVRKETKLDYKFDDFTKNLFSIQHTVSFSPVAKVRP